MTGNTATRAIYETPALPDRRLRVAFVCGQSFALKTLFRGLFAHLRTYGFDSEAVTGDRQYVEGDPDFADVPVHVVPMRREPRPLEDLVALARLTRFFARNRFDVVHVSTPKAALLAAIAARLTGHRNILFVVRIRIYQDRTGLGRWILEKADWVVCRLARLVAPISGEMGDVMVADGVCPREKIRYFGKGSSNGIDVHRFSLTPETIAAGRAVREELGIPEDALVMVSVGRLALGKGIHNLPIVMDRLAEAGIEAWLILAGPEDWREPTERSVLDDLDARANVKRIGYRADPAPLYAASDLFLFPSSREGFGNVALEAQAMGLPAVGFDTLGVREAIADGVTGFLAPLGDPEEFARHAVRLMGDRELRVRMGETAVARVRAEFSNERVWGDIRATLLEMARR